MIGYLKPINRDILGAMQVKNRNLYLALSLGFAVLAMVSPNPLLSLGSLMLLVILLAILWRPGEPPALLYSMGFHWMQASILIFYANIEGQELQLLGYGAEIESATWLTLIGVLMVAIGMRIGAGSNYGGAAYASVSAISSQLSVRRLFFGSMLAIGAALIISRLAYMVPGLTQPMLALALLRWVVVYMFAYTVLTQHRGYRYLAVVLTVELLIGFLGFFSDFKTVLIIMLLAALTSPGALRGIRFRTAGALTLIILSLGVVWTGVKSEYREFLNQGTGQQVVLVPIGDRIGKLAELVGEMTPARFGDSVVTLVERVTYVYYFGQTMETVPRYIAHEEGLLWREAVSAALVPRLLNPGKRVIDDSERTSYYTGSRVAGAEEGTSISLGYVAESYIDFGPVGMMVPLLLWGLFVGRVYRWLLRSTRYPLVGYGSATVLIALGVSVLEQSNLKMVSAFVLGFLVLYFSQRILARRGLVLFAEPGVPPMRHAPT